MSSENDTNTFHLVVRETTFNAKGEEVYACAVSHDSMYLAVVLGDGLLIIADPLTFQVKESSAAGRGYDGLPCTAVRWLNTTEDTSYRIVTASSAGGVFLWNWDGEVLHRVARATEDKNEITCMDVSPDGRCFVTAGSDRTVRLYQEDGTLKAVLQRGFLEKGGTCMAHTSRIFSLRFVTPTILASGGWGGPVQVWDVSQREVRLQLMGTQVGSDGIERIAGTSCVIVTSRRAKEQVEVFDCISGQKLQDDSNRLSQAIKDHVPIMTKFCKASDLLWTITAEPSVIIVSTFTSGHLLATFESPYPLMSIHIHEDMPHNAYISCAEGKLLFLTLKM